MTKYAQKADGLTRRGAIKSGASTLLLAGAAPAIVPSRARAQQRTLKILQWKHFVPGYDRWFNETYAKAWGETHDTEVIVDNVGLGDIDQLAAAEAAAGQGHDLVMLLAPAAAYADKVVDHREVYEESKLRFGPPAELAVKSTLDPASGRYFGFCGAFSPALLTFRRDLWDSVSTQPDSWSAVLAGGRRIKLLHNNPIAISLAPEHNGQHSLRAIMYSFGSSVQDEDGRSALKSKATLEAVEYVKALYEQAMTEDVLGYDPSSNNRVMLGGESSLTLDTISIIRANENKELPAADHLTLARVPEGPAGRLAPAFGFYTYIIWKFAQNIEGAKQFLVDFVANSRAGFLQSGFQTMPTFPGAVPDLVEVVGGSPGASGGRYGVLEGVTEWMTNLGHPGYTNPAISEVYDRGLVPDMFAQAATGQLTPEEALDVADLKVRRIFEQRGSGRT